MSRCIRHTFADTSVPYQPPGADAQHYHACSSPCDRIVVGPGRECSGEETGHYRATLTERGLRNAERQPPRRAWAVKP